MTAVWIALVVALVAGAQAYSGGAPDVQCKDMTPQHNVDPQTSDLPYTVTFSKTAKIKADETLQITIDGPKAFKGFLLQIRDGDKAVGKFIVPETDKYAKTINCHGGKQTAATHKNSSDKKALKLEWKAPAKTQGKLSAYVTVAENGGVFWARHKVADLSF